jgi:hypothetical protein
MRGGVGNVLRMARRARATDLSRFLLCNLLAGIKLLPARTTPPCRLSARRVPRKLSGRRVWLCRALPGLRAPDPRKLMPARGMSSCRPPSRLATKLSGGGLGFAAWLRQCSLVLAIRHIAGTWRRRGR